MNRTAAQTPAPTRAGPATPAGPDPRRWLILAVVALAQLMVVLDATIVNIALPSAQHALGFSDIDRQWVVTAYSLAFGSLLLLSRPKTPATVRKHSLATSQDAACPERIMIMTTRPESRNLFPGRPVRAGQNETSAGRDRPLRRRAARACMLVLTLAGVLGLAGTGVASAAPQRPGHEAVSLADSPATVLGISGDGQATTTRSPFEAPLRVLVLDETGHVVEGAPVTFRIQTGYAGLTGTAAFPGGAQSADVVTGTNGRADSPALTAGADVGPLRVEASVPGATQTATFFLRVGYAPATQVSIVSGDAQSALAGTGFAHPLVARVLDAHGYPVLDGSKVTFQIEPTGPQPGSATFADGQTSATAGINALPGTAHGRSDPGQRPPRQR